MAGLHFIHNCSSGYYLSSVKHAGDAESIESGSFVNTNDFECLLLDVIKLA